MVVRIFFKGVSDPAIWKRPVPSSRNSLKCVTVLRHDDLVFLWLLRRFPTIDWMSPTSGGTAFEHACHHYVRKIARVLQCCVLVLLEAVPAFSYSWTVFDTLGNVQSLEMVSNQSAISWVIPQPYNRASYWRIRTYYRLNITGQHSRRIGQRICGQPVIALTDGERLIR